jgi:glycosyltransferase involved in cell wall biosynthesis
MSANSNCVIEETAPVAPSTTADAVTKPLRLAGKKVGMVMLSTYPDDPRPRRAVAALLKEGMTIDLICVDEGSSIRKHSSGQLEVIRIPIRHRRGGFLSYAYEYSAFIFLSAAILAWRSLQGRYDLIYVHNMPDILVACALIPKMLGAKVILDQHDPMPELMMAIFNKTGENFAVKMLRWLEKWSIRQASMVITVSDTFKRVFSSRSCSADKITVVMNSPDAEIFPYRSARSYAVRKPQQPFVIMFHGLLEDRNGFHVAIDAFAQVRERIPGAELRVYGRSTPYLERVMENVSRLGLDNAVHYLGPRTLEQLVDEIQACDVGIIPNPHNPFTDINTPTRIFEYLTLGKPVVACRTRGIEDYFSSESLFFFEPGNSADLARVIERAALDSAGAMEIAERGQQVYQVHMWRQERETLVNGVAGLLGV